MGLTLIEAATGCEKQPETRLEHLAVIKTFAEGELLSWLPFMNIAGGGLFDSCRAESLSAQFCCSVGSAENHRRAAPEGSPSAG